MPLFGSAVSPRRFRIISSHSEVWAPSGAAFDRQAAQDWEAFLLLRAEELRTGGRLAVTLPALDDDGLSGFEDLMDHANEVLAAMAGEGARNARKWRWAVTRGVDATFSRPSSVTDASGI